MAATDRGSGNPAVGAERPQSFPWPEAYSRFEKSVKRPGREVDNLGRIATVGGPTTTYRDGSTKRGRTYRYVVRAVNAIGLGPHSNEASAVAR